ncbi:hypothetical protein EV714DRAFT_269810 [Schizophyllum commune]
MALTQTATHAGPSWDEEVVPALRKRLQSESRSLARRISAVSVSSMDEYPSPTLSASTVRQSTSTASQQSSSTVPRPSYQSRTSSDRSKARGQPNGRPAAQPMDHHTASSSSSEHNRSRTYSQPRPPNARSPSPSRPASKSSVALANTSPKPTRIPMRARASSTVTRSPSAAPYADGNQVSYPPSPQAHLLREPPPFNPASSTSSIGHPETPPGQRYHPYLPDESPPRASIESEERPYEHWYRGDVSRNGGVGELKVGRRQEMLDIANYGHALRMQEDERRRRIAALDESRSGSVVGFVGERDRGSLYIDDERYESEDGVMEEHPLTDMDEQEITEDDYREEEEEDDNLTMQQHNGYAHADQSTQSAPGRFSRSEDRSETPTRAPSRTPTPSQGRALNGSAARKSPTPTPSSRKSPTPTSRMNGKSPAASRKSPTPAPRMQKPRAGSEEPQTNTPKPPRATKAATSAGRRGPPPSATKRKQKAPTTRKEKEEDRRSIAHYPSISADEDAIPVWTQPKKAGNWDEVILPAVARKQGLSEHYEQADGSPKPVQRRSNPAPAPGTFGFDHSKYRPPRDGEAIEMDEFGRPIEQEDDRGQEEQEEERNHATEQQQQQPPRRHWNAHDETPLPITRPPQPPSPAPFSHYLESTDQSLPPMPPPPDRQPQRVDEDDAGGGCCKCVVM